MNPVLWHIKFIPWYAIMAIIGVIIAAIAAPFIYQSRKEKKWLFTLAGAGCILLITLVISLVLGLGGNPGIEADIEIRWYAFFIILGMAAAIGISAYFFKRKGHDPYIVIDFALIIIPLGIVGARLYYVLFQLSEFKSFSDVITIWKGGLAIYGGVIGGILGALIVCKYKKLNFLEILDCIVPGLILAQAIGRWGNFFNQEAYGGLITNPKLQWFPFAVYIDNQAAWYQATFFYESFFNLIGFALLFILAYKYKGKAKGLIFFSYLTFYGIVRVVIEGFRSDSLYIGSVRVSQLLSAILIAAGAAAIIYEIYYYHLKKPRPEAVENSAPEEKAEADITDIKKNDIKKGENKKNGGKLK